MTVQEIYDVVKKQDGWALGISDTNGSIIGYCNAAYKWDDIHDAVKCMEVEEITPCTTSLFVRVTFPVENIHETEDQYIADGYEKICNKHQLSVIGSRTIFAKKIWQPDPYTGGCDMVGYRYAVLEQV